MGHTGIIFAVASAFEVEICCAWYRLVRLTVVGEGVKYHRKAVGKVPYPAYPGYIPGVFHTRIRVGIVGMTSENT